MCKSRAMVFIFWELLLELSKMTVPCLVSGMHDTQYTIVLLLLLLFGLWPPPLTSAQVEAWPHVPRFRLATGMRWFILKRKPLRRASSVIRGKKKSIFLLSLPQQRLRSPVLWNRLGKELKTFADTNLGGASSSTFVLCCVSLYILFLCLLR